MALKEKIGFASIDNPHLAQYDPRQVAEAFEGLDMTADAFLFAHCTGEQRKDYAVRFMGQRTTYGQLDAEIERLGFGVRQGDYVTISRPNVKESCMPAGASGPSRT